MILKNYSIIERLTGGLFLLDHLNSKGTKFITSKLGCLSLEKRFNTVKLCLKKFIQ